MTPVRSVVIAFIAALAALPPQAEAVLVPAAGPTQSSAERVQTEPEPAVPGGGAPRGGARGRQAMPSPEGRTVAEVEQLFDNYVMRQARQFLRLTPEQARDFGPRLRQLQMTRRRTARQHQMLLRELNDLTRATGAQDDAAIAAKMAALDQQNATAEQQLREAYQAVEQVLTVPQRGRLRVFEQQMERQKLDLMARARDMARGRGRGPAVQGTPDLPAADLPGR